VTTSTTVLGYPRIGPKRELKRAIEAYWSGQIDSEALQATATQLREATWRELDQAGLTEIPGNTFSFYDQVLDAAVMVGALPDRVQQLGLSPLDAMFAAARGTQQTPPLEMTKWFDTNYHHLVPELGPQTQFTLTPDQPLADLAHASQLGLTVRPVLVGPVTFLLSSKSPVEGFDPLSLLDDLLDVYAELLTALRDAGAQWVQLDEPAFAADRTEAELAALKRAYVRLGAQTNRPAILVAGYFGDLGPALDVLAASPVDGLALDLVTGPEAVTRLTDPALADKLSNKRLVAGLVDGRNVWRTDLPAAASTARRLEGVARDLWVSSSCSLLHVPYDLDAEPDLSPDVRGRLAFARQKVTEITELARTLDGPADEASASTEGSTSAHNPDVRARAAAVTDADRARAPYSERNAAQRAALDLPPLPTTTIGSFPQTAQVRTARADLVAGRVTPDEYTARMRTEIASVITLQEDLGLDVLVHGEPERNDMVQYFAELLDGYAVTRAGWVQSYGTRCVRPPILYGDVSRPTPMTVDWATHAQGLTDKPVKGMLTGPVTMLAWSFVRDDQPLAETATQVALALRDEVTDLEQAGISIIQVDEPALRELLPLRAADQPEYLKWSVGSFRLATGSAAPATQVHTHLCYSEFGEIMPAIDGLDADVTTIEAARSDMEVLADVVAAGFERQIGPGVYDIHSPRVPSTEEIADLLHAALSAIPADRLWVNPDCGLKTRTYAQATPALEHMVAAARQVRD
jgi:5-methyltetrahydropteroyltriglutamate--homocysteine methyltransferase